MKILIAGGEGMLGRDLSAAFFGDFEVVSLSRHKLDICNKQAVTEAMQKHRPEVVINSAAYTNVDGCETETDLAYRINAEGAGNLAAAAAQIGAGIVQVSTDYVFDGTKKEPYTEDDPVNPLGVYGKSKLEGENLVRGANEKHFIVRTQWLYGAGGKNFVKTMLGLAEKGNKITVVNDQLGQPTYTPDLAAAIARLVTTKDYGIYHITNTGIVSWYEFTKEIFRQCGYENKVELEPCTTAEFPRPAKRPAYAPLLNKRWTDMGHGVLRRYELALADYLASENLKR